MEVVVFAHAQGTAPEILHFFHFPYIVFAGCFFEFGVLGGGCLHSLRILPGSYLRYFRIFSFAWVVWGGHVNGRVCDLA